MKFVCDACERLVEPAAFRIEDAALVLQCPRCQLESRQAQNREGAEVALPNPTPASRPVVVPFAPRPGPVDAATEPEDEAPVEIVPASERCPKCAEPKRGRDACAKCGLVFELYKPEQDAIPNSARRDFAQMLESADLRPLDVATTEKLAQFARLCRHHLADFPGDERAGAILEKITARSLALAAASSKMEAMSAGGDKAKMLAFAALFFLVLAATAVFVSALRH